MSAPAGTDPDERVRLDYAQTTGLVRDLTEIRFKLLAFVPTISGAAVALAGHRPSSSELVAIGALGLVATLGVVVYELRNTQVYDYAIHRAKQLEAELGLVSAFDPSRPGGLFTERPGRDLHVFGLAAAGHDRGLALVYGAAIGGWSYLLGWGVLRGLDLAHAQTVGLAIGTAAGLLMLLEFLRIDTRPSKAGT